MIEIASDSNGDFVRLRFLYWLTKWQGIILVTHDPHAARYATRTLYLEKGLLLTEAQAAEMAQV
ncbi:MAG: hypothetical protein WBV94_19760 [Blastocatellia bacterium]